MSDDPVYLIGLSHRTAPVGLRERLAFRAADLPRALGGVLARGCREAAILSTCNRVEVYAISPAGAAETPARLRGFLSEYHGLPEAAFEKSLYQFSGVDAVQHLFEVTASLDSQILGETEILAQAKEAYRAAAETGACGPMLRALFERSFFLAKQVRAEGGIAHSLASVSSAAVALAKKVFELKGCKVLVLGTGEMADGIVRALHAAGAGEILAAGRTGERAAEFAKHVGAKPCELRDLAELLPAVDLVLVSTAAPHYILRPAEIQAGAAKRHGRALCIIDISVPRNADPVLAEYPDTFLYDIDDLEEVAREGRVEREQAAAQWRPRLANEARELVFRWRAYDADYTAQKLIEHAAALRAEVMQQAKLAKLEPQAVEEIERVLDKLQKRFLHGPLEALKQAAREGNGSDASAWVVRLFRLGMPAAQEKAATPPPVIGKDVTKSGSSDKNA